MFPVRHLATSSGTRAAAAAFEHSVAVWDLENGTQISTFETVLDFGGRRLVINEAGTLCATAAYTRRGLACYDVQTGSIVWGRPDLKRLQNLSVSADSSKLYCCSDITSCAVLDIDSGSTLDTWRGARGVIESRYNDVTLLEGSQLTMLRGAEREAVKIPRMTFGLLDAAFSPSIMCLSESGGPVRAIETESGREVWRYTPPSGRHVLRLAYVASAGAFGAIEYWYEQNGCPRTLLLLSQETGESSSVAGLGSVSETEFCFGGEALLTAEGELLSTRSGAVTRSLWAREA